MKHEGPHAGAQTCKYIELSLFSHTELYIDAVMDRRAVHTDGNVRF